MRASVPILVIAGAWREAGHADDERLVFWEADAARSSEATLSAPAATWLHACLSVDPAITA